MALPKLDAPRYEMTVPSTQEKVVYRPYLVKEEKILMMALESQDDKQMVRALKDVIKSCTEGSVNVDNLAMFDLEYIFIQLRAKSAGESTKISIKCKECETKNDVVISLEDVSVKNLSKKEHKIKLTDDYVLVMKYPSVNDLLNAQTKNDADTMLDVVASCIDSLHTSDEVFDMKEQSKAEIKEFIESLNSEQFSKIKDFLEGMPSAQSDINFNCENCGTTNEHSVKGLANFFG